LGIVLFFIAYFSLGSNKESYMPNNSLNWIFMTFFIIMFFLMGYLLQNVFLSFKEVKKPNRPEFINTHKLDNTTKLENK